MKIQGRISVFRSLQPRNRGETPCEHFLCQEKHSYGEKRSHKENVSISRISSFTTSLLSPVVTSFPIGPMANLAEWIVISLDSPGRPTLKRTFQMSSILLSERRRSSAGSRLARARICSVISSRSRASSAWCAMSRVMSPCQTYSCARATSARAYVREPNFYKDGRLILDDPHNSSSARATRAQLPP